MNPMDKKDFILLKAIFDLSLYNALMNENVEELEVTFKTKYSYEISENMVNDYLFTKEDVINLKKQYIEERRTDDLSWAL